MTIKERLLLIKKLARIYGTYEVLNSGDTFKWAHKYTFSFFSPRDLVESGASLTTLSLPSLKAP